VLRWRGLVETRVLRISFEGVMGGESGEKVSDGLENVTSVAE